MHHSSPHVSIITPARNAARWIEGAISSVQAQTYTDWEMLIVDDGSVDNTAALVRSHAATDRRLRLIEISHSGGAAQARNAALEAAQGRFIAFLDADDLWDSTKLETQIAAMLDHGWVFSWTSYRVEKIHADGSHAPPPYPLRHALPAATRQDLLSKRGPIGCLTAIYDTDAFGKVPMVAIPKRHDFVLWAELMQRAEAQGWRTGGITQPLATYRHRADSLSGNKWAAAAMQWEALRRHCGVGRCMAVWYFTTYAGRGLWDRIMLRSR